MILGNGIKNLTAVPGGADTTYSRPRRGVFCDAAGEVDITFCDSESKVTLNLLAGTYYDFLVKGLDTEDSAAATLFVGPEVG